MKIKARDIKGIKKCIEELNVNKIDILHCAIKHKLSDKAIALCLNCESDHDAKSMLFAFMNEIKYDTVISLLEHGYSADQIFAISNYVITGITEGDLAQIDPSISANLIDVKLADIIYKRLHK